MSFFCGELICILWSILIFATVAHKFATCEDSRAVLHLSIQNPYSYQSSFLQFFLKLDDVQMANSAFRNHASYSRHSGSVDTSPVSSCLNFRA